jgi:hypothetical protein
LPNTCRILPNTAEQWPNTCRIIAEHFAEQRSNSILFFSSVFLSI